jgi:hypothetical protein
MYTTNTQHDEPKRGQPKPVRHVKTAVGKGAKHQTQTINWNEWWPFTRATGAALKQLNRRQSPQSTNVEEAPL